MSAKLLSRVWTTSAAVALIFSVGTWVMLQDRVTWIVGDDVLLAEALMERAGACEWTNEPVHRTYWTSLRTRTNGAVQVWGGFDWVEVANMPVAAGSYNGTYHYEGRHRTLQASNTRVVPDRGFCDVYTSGVRRLVDLGPAGGSSYNGSFGTATRMVPVGGWALLPDFFLTVPLYLPRHFHLSSGHFLRPANATTEAQLTSLNMATYAPLYDPSTIIIVPGPIAPNRVTYWQPLEVYFTTNEITQLPWSHDRWYDANLNLSGRDPRVVFTPKKGLDVLNEIDSDIIRFNGGHAIFEDRYFCDASHGAGTSDFSGWTNPLLPEIGSNASVASNLAVWRAWQEAGPPTRSLTAYRAFGAALLDHTTLSLECKVEAGVKRATPIAGNRFDWDWSDSDVSGWTNVVARRYISRVVESETYAGAVAEVASNPGWELHDSTNLPLCKSVWYFVAHADYNIASNLWRFVYEYAQGTPMGFTGLGHNTNGYYDITAHGFLEQGNMDVFQIPDAETVVAGTTGRLFRIELATGGIDPVCHVFATRVPGYVGPPSSALILSLGPGGTYSSAGYEVIDSAVAARPIFDVFDYMEY